MTPSVSQLLSWQPGQVGQAGQTLLAQAADLQRCAGELTSIRAGLSGVWSGAAAQAATAHHARRSAEVDELATVVHTAGQALLRAADALAQARTSLQSALAAAAAAGCTVLDDGTVLPPARPPVPAGLTDEDLTSWQAEADATAAAQAAGAARLAQQIRAALAAAGSADAGSAAALSALEPPQVSPAPQPVPMGLTGGQWGPIALPSCPVTPPTSAAPAPEDDEDGGFWSGLGHGALDVVGLVPVLGEPADGINALWYEAEGDHLNAALSAAGMLPIVGMGATAAKVGLKGAKATDEAVAAARAPDAAPVGRGADDVELGPAARAEFDDWAAGLETLRTPTNDKAYNVYERRVTGDVNYRLQGGGERVDTDGLDPRTGQALDAKHITPGRSPFVADSSIPPFVREKITAEVADEFYRYSRVIADPANPLTGLRVIVSDASAVPHFEQLMRSHGIAGRVVVQP